jgi:histidyl-tRNA synthetase
MQFDADTVGSASPAADAEMCMMAADTMEALGIERGSYVVKVNNRKVLDGVMESIELGGEENAGKRLTVLRAIDKLDRLGDEGVRQLLGEGRKDESGDFTKGAGLAENQVNFLLNFLRPVYGYDVERDDITRPYHDMEPVDPNHGDPSDKRFKFVSNSGTTAHQGPLLAASELGTKGLNELNEIAILCESVGYGSRRIKIDPAVIRGLEYYTGPVFEIELTLGTKDEKGRPVRFGSVGGGGRYDGLVSRFRGEPVPATGFSIGVSRLQAALTMLGKLDTTPEFGPVVVTVFGGEIAGYQKMVAILRNANIRAELYLGNPKHSIGQQMKYADRRNSPCAIIQGSDEKANGKIQIKDLILGAGLTEIKDREEYLKKQAEAQYEVDEEKLVEAVREVLARHEVKWA